MVCLKMSEKIKRDPKTKRVYKEITRMDGVIEEHSYTTDDLIEALIKKGVIIEDDL